MNVLLVTVDSLRADRVTDRVMPNTREFADTALEYETCIANGPSTPASFPAIHASRHFASIEGIGLPSNTDGDIKTVAEVLHDAGYETAGYTDNHFASGSYNYDRGFSTMYDASGHTEAGRLKQFVQSNLDKNGALFRTIETLYTRVDALLAGATGSQSEYERGASLNQRALEWIDHRDDDWFTWLHYMDAHHPYEAPPEYQREFLDEPVSKARCRALSRKGTHHPGEVTKDEWEVIEGLYDAECRYVDTQFDQLRTALETRDLMEETAIVFTADHGELVGEHGHAGHPPEFWEGILRVPLLIAHPSLNSDTVPGQVRLLDIPPTITDLVDIDSFDGWDGESVLDLLRDDLSARQHAFADVGREIQYDRCCVRRSDGWKLLRHGDDGTFLFNLAESPDETKAADHFNDSDAPTDDLESILDEHIDRMQVLRFEGTRAVGEEDEIVENHLRELGYLE